MKTPFSENLRRWNRECSGYEPSMSMLQRGADDAADLIDELCDALEWWNKQATSWIEAREKHARPGWVQPAIEKSRAALVKAREEAE